MELILLTIILILLFANLCVALMKNNRRQTEQLESLFRQELKENREELSRNMRELRTELNQAISLSTQQMQTTLHRNLMTTNEMQREKFEAMNRQQDILVKSTEKRLDEMRLMVEEKLQKTLNERIGQSFELVRSQLENVQKGLGEMKTLAEDVGGLKKVLGNVKTRGTFGEIQLSALLEQMLSPEQYEANVKTRKNATEFVEFAIKLPGKDNGKDVVYLPIDAKFPKDVYEQYIDAYEEGDASLIESAGTIRMYTSLNINIAIVEAGVWSWLIGERESLQNNVLPLNTFLTCVDSQSRFPLLSLISFVYYLFV